MHDYSIEEEVWKDIKGYEGLYMISNYGNVFSIKRNLLIKLGITKGYHAVMLSKDNKKSRRSVHRLVAIAFIENPENKREVNHSDENKLNNYIGNLQWVTPKENANWGTRNKRISEYVKANPVKGKTHKGIRQIEPDTGEAIKVYESVAEASIQNGFHQGNISSCLTGKRPFASGYKWEYIN